MIKVGGATEVEVKEKKDRVEDALNATRAAVEEGIVPGGGVALLRAKKAVGKLTNDNADVQAGINIVLKAIEAPIRQIAENSGVEGSIVVGKILENKSETFGFDAQTEEYVDMIDKGIVDPAKVVRAALQDAASVAGLLVTTEAMVAEVPKDKPAMPGGGMPRRWRRHGRDGFLIRRRTRRIKSKGAARGPFFLSPEFERRLIRRQPKTHRRAAGERDHVAALAPAGYLRQPREHGLVGLRALRRAGLIVHRADRDRDRIARDRRLPLPAPAPQIDLRPPVGADRQHRHAL